MMAFGISCVYMQDSVLHSYCGTRMQNYVLVFTSSSSLLVHSSRVPCKYNSTRNSIEWFCLLDKILQASATLPLSGTVTVEPYS